MNLFYQKGLLIGVLFLCFAIFSCKDNNPAKPPVAGPTELEGAWSGKNVDGIDQRLWFYVFRANTIVIDSITFSDTVEADSGTFTLDTMTFPKSINILVLFSPNSPDAGKTILARYNLSGGNVLHITANAAGTPRPDSVAPPAPVIGLLLQQ